MHEILSFCYCEKNTWSNFFTFYERVKIYVYWPLLMLFYGFYVSCRSVNAIQCDFTAFFTEELQSACVNWINCIIINTSRLLETMKSDVRLLTIFIYSTLPMQLELRRIFQQFWYLNHSSHRDINAMSLCSLDSTDKKKSF